MAGGARPETVILKALAARRDELSPSTDRIIPVAGAARGHLAWPSIRVKTDATRASHSPTQKLDHAVYAAIDAAAVEAIRVRKEPGEWTGAKGTRVATAAMSAAVLDVMSDDHSDSHSKWGLARSVLGGLVANRMLKGPRHEHR